MYGRKRLTLGGWLLLVLFIFGVSLYWLLSRTNLLWHGVTTRGVIVAEQGITCGRSQTERQSFSVQFTDQAGQTQVGTISQCDYDLNASPGDSVAIVYLPDDPTVIAPPDGLIANVQGDLIFTILLGLITLILLPFWIRKRIPKASFSTQEKLAAQRNAQEFDRKLEEALKQAGRNPEGGAYDNPDHTGS